MTQPVAPNAVPGTALAGTATRIYIGAMSTWRSRTGRARSLRPGILHRFVPSDQDPASRRRLGSRGLSLCIGIPRHRKRPWSVATLGKPYAFETRGSARVFHCLIAERFH